MKSDNCLTFGLTVNASTSVAEAVEAVGVRHGGHLLFLDVVHGDAAAVPPLVGVAASAAPLGLFVAPWGRRGPVPVGVLAVLAARMLGHPLCLSKLCSSVLEPNLQKESRQCTSINPSNI